MEYDIHNSITGRNALDIQAIATDTTTNGEIIDTQGFESIDFHFLSGTITDGAYALVIQDGDESDLSDAANVDSELVLGDLTGFVAADDNTVIRVGTVSKKRYVRASIVSTSTTSGGTFGCVAVLGHPKVRPTS